MNAYDFDKTIYHYDSTVTFYLWCLARYPKIALRWPRLIAATIAHKLGRIDVHEHRERFFEYLKDVPDLEKELDRFWDRHIRFMHAWYRETQREDDLIISASPYFLVKPAADRLGVRLVMGSPLNPETGRYEGERCHGGGKVRAFRAAFPDGEVGDFYSDSLSDSPMANLARRAYLVSGEKLTNWPEKRKDTSK